MPDALSAGSVLMDLMRVVVTLLPAMTANTFAPFFGGGMPVDFGKARKDGRRYLGDGKTWRGLFGGVSGAALLGISLFLVLHITGVSSIEDSLWGPFPINLLLLILLPIGSLFGDMLGSFIKRALNRPRGKKTPLLDQWDYIIGTIIFILPFYPWWYDTFIAENAWIASLLFLAVAFLAHTVANWIGYWIGVKKEPW
ncbi:MAG: CDP-2,3-bis-(O-geranylgeranyl)-sn-glycerol synthase [Candidatus Thermoplasmatota archaeon]|nr:CDP-2,3-bis-(O-geranylgeranyl)-sn-glycerol synthase [Candidatus Thermoplasmatota archaeon]